MANYTMPSVKVGETFEGVCFTMSRNNIPLDLTSASIVMNVSANGINIEFSTINEKLRIMDAPNGVFEFRKQFIDFWSYGVFPYDITINFPNGDIKKYITGTWTILRD